MSEPKLKTYVVSGYVTASVFTEVKARNAKEAKELAISEHSTPGLCHHCTGAGDPKRGEWALSDGIDGEVKCTDVERVPGDAADAVGAGES